MTNRKMNIGIGFATGRKTFKNVVRTYVENWCESGLMREKNIRLNLLIAYDLAYKNTKPSDYRNLDPRISDMLDYPLFIDDSIMSRESAILVSMGIITKYEAELLFGDGYGRKRNAIMYFAAKNNMDGLLFIDDDEYPLAVSRTPEGLNWKGQHVLTSHLEHMESADITHGHHCGYVSPIPQVQFNRVLREEDFRLFIETIKNDIISWDCVREKMLDGGVTYCSDKLLGSRMPTEVTEINGAKFISGSNLFLNLNSAGMQYPFYNPPGARGEDTFLSTCLTDIKVLKVPCYTFHDGFSTYPHLLHGSLPMSLKPNFAGEQDVDDRFFRACVGWIRYKPLYLYITKRQEYQTEIDRMKANLALTLPKLRGFFGRDDLMSLRAELDAYSGQVARHYEMFEETKLAWRKVINYLKNREDSFYLEDVIEK